MTVAELLASAERQLAARGVSETAANAEWIMAYVLKAGRGELKLHGSRTLSVKQENSFKHLIEQRSRRTPLAYLLGTQPFLGLDIQVGEGALIPRSETEELVDEASRLFKPRAQEALDILEIGTGTGCIAVALAALFPRSVVYATDISASALELARRNADLHHRTRQIRFVSEDLFKPDHKRRGWADLVISNPPYIRTSELDGLDPEVLKEPRLALDGGPDGLAHLRAIIADAPSSLKTGGWLALEIGSDQGPAVRALLQAQGLSDVVVRRDAQGHERIALARRPPVPRADLVD